MSNEKRDRLKENISIIKRHNDTGIPVVSLTNRNKFEVQVIDEIIEDVSLVIEKMENKTLIEIPESGIGDLSDGYHTFNELYHHRAVLFSVICNLMPERAWKSKLHDTGDMFEGMFIVGLETPDGPATYHYDINPYWDMFKVKELERAPKWDGHTSTDAINRIASLARDFIDAGPTIIEMDLQGIDAYLTKKELTTLLHTIEDHPEKTCPRKESESCDGCEYITESGNGCDSIARRADYLIKNGVIAPPCKIGTTLYFLYNSPHANKPDLTYRIYESNEWYFHIDENGISIQTRWVRGCDGEYHYYLDKNVFLTKNQAEQKLKEMRGE